MSTRADKAEKRFEWPLIVAAVLVIPTIALEQSTVSEPWDALASVLNWGIWLVFTAELVTMLWLTPNRWRYLRDHPLDVAIVLLTPPFLPASMQAARVFRLLRLLRLLKTAALLRRLLSVEGIRDAAVLAVVIVIAGGTAFAAVESPEQRLSSWDGIWWAVTTVTTVGYGDITPMTDAGRVIGMTVMLVGIGFVALVTGAAAERFIKGAAAPKPDLERQLAEVNERLANLERLLERRPT
ncbi:MAG: ion channel [Solirubrobacteraceae bacterium]|nr:ion channel [Solirubrobacteraceae bacterium]